MSIFMCPHTHTRSLHNGEEGQDGKERKHPGGTGTGEERGQRGRLSPPGPPLPPNQEVDLELQEQEVLTLTWRKVSKCSNLFYKKPLPSALCPSMKPSSLHRLSLRLWQDKVMGKGPGPQGLRHSGCRASGGGPLCGPSGPAGGQTRPAH